LLIMAAEAGHRLTLDKITQRFGNFVAVRDISLEVAGGELIALLGPSGCGKSTLLRIISGFIRQSEGRVLFDSRSVDGLSAGERGVGIVFQNYALFPHMTVAENVAYGLHARKWRRDRIAARVSAMLELVHMAEFAGRKPRQLSGGQQQRVALARCLAIDPKLLLLDEPFAALDKNLRLDMQIELKRLQRDCSITTILVTHDQEEALSLADRVAVMSRGNIEQIASPTEIYDEPRTLFVNQFVGASNALPGDFVMLASGAHVALAGGATLPVGGQSRFAGGSRVVVCIRPEHVRFEPVETSAGIAGTVKAVMPVGAHVIYEVETPAGLSLKVSEPRAALSVMHDPGERVRLVPVSASLCHVFPAA
jgi:putative spermidine/putrescine transport system ATP-binding protein